MAINVSDRAQAAYRYRAGISATDRSSPQTDKSVRITSPDSINRRDTFERSEPNPFFTGYDTLNSEEIRSFKYRIEHSISRNASWFHKEAGNDLQRIKEEKGYYNGSDILNAYGYAYARLYAEIEQRYENGDEQWFDPSGKPLTKEKEIEKLDRAYEGAVEWTVKCAEIMANLQNMNWNSLSDPIQSYDRPEPEVSRPSKKDLEEMKSAFYRSRELYMELYRECRPTGRSLTAQNYAFDHNALLSFLAKTWSEDTHR